MNMRAVDQYFKKTVGGYAMSKWRKNILPVWLTYDLASQDGALTVQAAGTDTKTVEFRQPFFSNMGLDNNLGTPLEIRSLIWQTTANLAGTQEEILVDLYEAGEVRKFMNRPIHVLTLFGNGQLPAVLREPIFMNSMHFIQFNATKITGTSTDSRFYLVGAQYYPWSPAFLADPSGKERLVEIIKKWQTRKQFVMPYWLTPEEATISKIVNQATGSGVIVGANATEEVTAKIGDDGHFELLTLTARATGNFGLTITETYSHQTLMNGQITQTNGLGTAQFPVMFPVGYIIPAGRYLRFSITDLSGSNNNVFLTLGGRKIFAPFKKAQETEFKTRFSLTPMPPVPADSAREIVTVGP